MLESRARTRSGSVAEAMRSKIVLSLAAGNSQAQTIRTVGCSVNTVRLWKERFVGERLGGLYGRHRGRSRSKESVRLEAGVTWDCFLLQRANLGQASRLRFCDR